MLSICVPVVTKCVARTAKKTVVVLQYIVLTAKGVLPAFITKKTEHFSFKSGCVVQVKNG